MFHLRISDDEENIPEDLSDPDAFLSDGTWNKVHIRRIIHIMDSFKISNEAYHEMRMTSKSILPSISRIKKEKAIMSKEISYTAHPTVGQLPYVETLIFVSDSHHKYRIIKI